MQTVVDASALYSLPFTDFHMLDLHMDLHKMDNNAGKVIAFVDYIVVS